MEDSGIEKYRCPGPKHAAEIHIGYIKKCSVLNKTYFFGAV